MERVELYHVCVYSGGGNGLKVYEDEKLPVVYVETMHDSAETIWEYSLQLYQITYMHYHNLLEIGWCIEGEGKCITEDKKQKFSAGDVEIIFPFQKHLSKSSSENPSKWYYLSIDPVQLLSKSHWFMDSTLIWKCMNREIGEYGIFNKYDHPQITALTIQLIKEILSTDQKYSDEMIVLRFVELLIELSRLSENRQRYPVSKSSHEFSQIQAAISLVQKKIRMGMKINISELSETCMMSESHFRRLFKEIIGQTPHQFVQEAVIRKSQQLLTESDKSIIEIANFVGFEDASGFNRIFLKYCNMTPSAFRALYNINR